MGFLPYIWVQTTISIIFSALIYFESIEIDSYILSMTIASVEYIKINILEIISFFYETNYKTLEFFSSSTIFSIYLLIWDIAVFLLSLIDIQNKYVLLFQFIIGLVAIGPFTFFSVLTGINLSCMKLCEKNNDEVGKQNRDIKRYQKKSVELESVKNNNK